MASNDLSHSLSESNQVSSLSFSKSEVTSVGLTTENATILNLFDDDSNQSVMSAGSEPEDIFNEIGDIDATQLESVHGRSAALFDYLTLLSKNAANNDGSLSSVANANKPFVVKSSSMKNTIHLLDGKERLTTNRSLELTVSPCLYQHVRYAKELDETLRYMSMPADDPITLRMPDFENLHGTDVSLWLRILRITKPYGPNQMVFVHPYPIWMNHEFAQVYKNGLFIPVASQTIKIDTLTMQRLLQGELRDVNAFTIHSSEKLNLNDLYPINISKAKHKIPEYQLYYSALHFQIFVVDRNNVAHPTDLECQTQFIYEYEANEFSSLPLMNGGTQAHSNKRKQTGQGKKFQSMNKKKPHGTCQRLNGLIR